MVKIFINPGHGGSDPGATANGLKEKDLVLKIAKKIANKVNSDYEGATVKLFRSTDKFYSLGEITKQANNWGADIFISIHINAFNTVAKGFESFIFNGRTSSKTKSNQKTIHVEIMKAIKSYNVTDRGQKTANFHVLRETGMPAILTETLFIDNKDDARLLKSDKFINDVSNGHVLGIAKATGLKKKTSSKTSSKTTSSKSSDTMYRVVTGSFKDKSNAQDRVNELKRKGLDSFIDVNKKYHRVVTGSFADKSNAEQRVSDLKKAGFDSFIDVHKK